MPENPKWVERVVIFAIQNRKVSTFQLCIHFYCAIIGLGSRIQKILGIHSKIPNLKNKWDRTTLFDGLSRCPFQYCQSLGLLGRQTCVTLLIYVHPSINMHLHLCPTCTYTYMYTNIYPLVILQAYVHIHLYIRVVLPIYIFFWCVWLCCSTLNLLSYDKPVDSERGMDRERSDQFRVFEILVVKWMSESDISGPAPGWWSRHTVEGT